jgi:hypothetical protein
VGGAFNLMRSPQLDGSSERPDAVDHDVGTRDPGRPIDLFCRLISSASPSLLGLLLHGI